MRSIETKAVVTKDGELTLKVPPDVKPGEHNIKLVIQDSTYQRPEETSEFLVIHIDSWPEDLSLRREDMYDDDGR